MTLRIKTYVAALLTIAVVLIGACKPSVKGQTKDFERSIALLNTFKGDFPGFAAYFQATIADYEAKWKAASEISDEEKRAEAMKKVNSSLDDDALYDALQKYNSRKGGLDRFVNKYAGKTIKYKNRSTFNSLNTHITDSQDVLSRVPRELASANPSSKTDAAQMLKDGYDQLNKQYLSNMSIERRLKKEQKELKAQ